MNVKPCGLNNARDLLIGLQNSDTLKEYIILAIALISFISDYIVKCPHKIAVRVQSL